jgi:hypothetical protein
MRAASSWRRKTAETTDAKSLVEAMLLLAAKPELQGEEAVLLLTERPMFPDEGAMPLLTERPGGRAMLLLAEKPMFPEGGAMLLLTESPMLPDEGAMPLLTERPGERAMLLLAERPEEGAMLLVERPGEGTMLLLVGRAMFPDERAKLPDERAMLPDEGTMLPDGGAMSVALASKLLCLPGGAIAFLVIERVVARGVATLKDCLRVFASAEDLSAKDDMKKFSVTRLNVTKLLGKSRRN